MDKYELAMLNHSNSIYGRPSGGSGPSPPPRHDLKFHPRSDSGQHSVSFERWSSYLKSLGGGAPDRNHPDNPRHFFGIMEVTPDIHYMREPTVKKAFEEVIRWDNSLPEILKTMTGGKRRKKHKGRKTKKRRSQKKRKRKRSRKQKKRKSKKKHT